ncbi:MAG: Maf family nucleotide pyrophosphatase [Flavobacteriales bacterium]|jgi:septum formation protein
MLLAEKYKNHKIVLASKSPRRQELMKGLDISFEVRTMEVDESFPPALQREEIPLFLSKLKAQAFLPEMKANEVVITADTVVWVNDHVLNKPEDRDEAIAMVKELSGNKHVVYTGVTITTKDKALSFYDETKVYFEALTQEEIEYYIDKYQPYDKAGSYGVQEFIGYMGINKLEGSYFNVMGLPVHQVYKKLMEF